MPELPTHKLLSVYLGFALVGSFLFAAVFQPIGCNGMAAVRAWTMKVWTENNSVPPLAERVRSGDASKTLPLLQRQPQQQQLEHIPPLQQQAWRTTAGIRRSNIVSKKQCPLWLSEYQAMHKKRKGANGAKYLVHLAESTGGLGDRLHGALSTLRLAYALDRVLLLKWTEPTTITDFLQPASGIDWTVEGLALQPGKVLTFINKPGWADPILQNGSLAAINDTFLTVRTNMHLNRSCHGCPG